MDRLKTCRRWLVTGTVLVLTMAAANAGTIATFADPAGNGSTPLFELDGTQFTGGWYDTGLTLETPGLPIPDIADATFEMSDLTVTPIVPGIFSSTDAGTVEFYDNLNQLVLLIEFDSAYLTTHVSVGASDANLQNVRFTVPGDPTVYTDEYFSFSFANGLPTANGWTWTASFTSSAVPEPGTGLLVLVGGLLAAVRRR
ncbi:MAG: PEP-CTERM sorting domain-containing protein [Phycisphaerae bacterium]|nr:PEP-CTERM sorting domain-containing protein [Phycisphaerae bacterium]